MNAVPATTPEHSIRLSRKARRVTLRVVPGKGLEVVIPERAAKGLPPSFVPDLLRRHKSWIERAMARLESRQAERVRELERDLEELPDRLLLNGGREMVRLDLAGLAPGLGQKAWLRASYGPPPSLSAPSPDADQAQPQSTPLPGADQAPLPVPGQAQPLSALLRGQEAAPGLLLTAGGPREALVPLLRQWLRSEARRRLLPRLEALSQRHGLPYSGLTFRLQKSRWGSCSSRGGISLNAFLIFLPEELADYVLLHELCHTRHLNHSQSYWRLVFALDPEALGKDKKLRRAWRYVPAWLQPGAGL